MGSQKETEEGSARQNLSEHLANERTMLAYVRTSIALLGFGLTLNRFGAFLRTVKPPAREERWYAVLHDANRMGIGMMVLGLVLLVWAAIHFVRVLHAIDRGDHRPRQLTVWILSSAIFVLGLFVTASVFLGR